MYDRQIQGENLQVETTKIRRYWFMLVFRLLDDMTRQEGQYSSSTSLKRQLMSEAHHTAPNDDEKQLLDSPRES